MTVTQKSILKGDECHPERVIPVCQCEAVERTLAALCKMSRNYEIIVSVIYKSYPMNLLILNQQAT